MTSLTLETNQAGPHEIRLAAGAPLTVFVKGTGIDPAPTVTITTHDAGSPVRVRPGLTVHTHDTDALTVEPGTWAELLLTYKTNRALSLICATDATVSVTRA